jgi:hypothetical protein
VYGACALALSRHIRVTDVIRQHHLAAHAEQVPDDLLAIIGTHCRTSVS